MKVLIFFPCHSLSYSRFVINCDNLHLNPLRVFYMTEHAYWHYIDFYCNEQPQLPRCGHKALTKHSILKHLQLV